MKKVSVEIQAKADQAIKAMQNFGKALEDVTAEAKDAAKELDNVGQEAESAGSEANKAKKKIDSMGNGLEKVGKAAQLFAASAIGQKIAGFASEIAQLGITCIQSAAQMKQYEIAFTTMLNSADAGKKMLADLKQFAASTPFDVPGVVQAGQQLMAFGFQAQEIIPMLTSLGDAAAGLGKGSAGVGQIAYAMGQMRTSGTLKTQDMMQLTNAGINAWQMLADASGKTIMEIKDLTERGAIDSAAAVEIIVAGMNAKFGGMMQKTSTEVAGLMANIEETAGNTAATVGEYMIKAFDIKGILKNISDALGDFQQKMQDATDEGKTFTEVIKDCVPASVVAAVGALAGAMGVVLYGAISTALGAFTALVGVSASVVAAFAGIGAAIAAVIVYWDEICEAFNAGMQAIATIIIGGLDAIAEAYLWMAKGGVEAVGWLFEQIGDYCPEWLSAFNGMLDSAIESIRSWAREAIGWFQEVFRVKANVMNDPYWQMSMANTDDDNKDGESNVGIPKAQRPLFMPEKPKAGSVKAPSYSDKTKPYDDRLRDLQNEFNATRQYNAEMRRITDERLKSEQKANQASLSGSELKQAQYMAEASALAEKVARENADHEALIANLNAQKTILEEQKAAGLLDGTQERIDLIAKQIENENILHSARQQAFAAEGKALEATNKTANILAGTYEKLGSEAISGIADAFTGCIAAGKSFGDAMAKMCNQMLQQVLQLIAQWLILTALMGVGGGIGSWAGTARGKLFAAGGGYISGPGTGTSDSIPAMLSNGEYIMSASAVDRIGIPLLNGLNSGRLDGFATGGYIGHAAYSNNGGTANVAMTGGNSVTMNVQAMDASSFSDFLARGALDVLRQATFENTRRFGTEAGTW